jgi:hypothetical protein
VAAFTSLQANLKGQCHEIFKFRFFHESVFPKPLSIQIGPFRIFSNIPGDIHCSRCTTSVIDTSGKWKNSSIIKVLIILFGHLWEVELTHRYIFFFKFTLRSKQPDIVPIICHIVDTSGKLATSINNTSKTGGKYASGVVDTNGAS